MQRALFYNNERTLHFYNRLKMRKPSFTDIAFRAAGYMSVADRALVAEFDKGACTGGGDRANIHGDASSCPVRCLFDL